MIDFSKAREPNVLILFFFVLVTTDSLLQSFGSLVGATFLGRSYPSALADFLLNNYWVGRRSGSNPKLQNGTMLLLIQTTIIDKIC